MLGRAVLLVLALAAGASAISEEALTKLHRMQADGDPLLVTYAEEIKAELATEQTDEDTNYAAYVAASCNPALSEISAEIARLTTSISTDNAAIEGKTATMGQISAGIPALRQQVEDFHDPINRMETELAGLKQTRDQQHTTFNEQMAEAVRAIKAIDEIRDFIQSSSLDTATTGASDYTPVSLLQEAMKTTTGIKHELMKTAVNAMLTGAVSSIYEILYKMREQFKIEIEEMQKTENDAFDAWESQRMQVRANIGDQLIQMEEAKQSISDQHTEMSRLEAEIATTNIQMANNRKSLNAEELKLEQRTKDCNDYLARHTAETARRQETAAALDRFIAATKAAVADNPDAFSSLANQQQLVAPDYHTLTEDEKNAAKLASGAGVVKEAMDDLYAMEQTSHDWIEWPKENGLLRS
jgi:predicted  nucleic acid-binding Zn-ribbon protein